MLTIAALAVTTWMRIADCEKVVNALERQVHAKAAQVVDKRVQRATERGVRARDVAQWCVGGIVGNEE